MSTETIEFQAEARQLLQLMIHSIYSTKDVFLRELISNSSDALDKLRLAAYQDKDLEVDTSDLHIALETDPAARTLTVRDNGIGMSRDEVVDLIGTIAKSGTAEMLAKLREARESGGTAEATAELIGQFGVGFYSSFMVADRVELVTRKAGATPACAGSRPARGPTPSPTTPTRRRAPRSPCTSSPRTPRTRCTTSPSRHGPRDRQALLRLHHLADPDGRPKPPEADGEDSDGLSTPCRQEVVNSRKALWARAQSEVSDEEYAEFYRHVSHDWRSRWRPSGSRPRAPSSTRRCCSCPATRRWTCSCGTASAACSSTSSACSSWTTARRWSPSTCASSRASSTRATCRSTSPARSSSRTGRSS